jgi:hypothetical protein
MHYVGTVLGLSLNCVQAQTTAILYRLHRALQHHNNPTYKSMADIVQVHYQVRRLKGGPFVGTLRLSMRSNSSLVHHILRTALGHDFVGGCNHFNAKPYNFLINFSSNPNPIPPSAGPNLACRAHNIPYRPDVLLTLMQSIAMSASELFDPYKIVVAISWDTNTKTPSLPSSPPQPKFVLMVHVCLPQTPDPVDRIGFATTRGQTIMASYLSRILLNQHNSTIHITMDERPRVLPPTPLPLTTHYANSNYSPQQPSSPVSCNIWTPGPHEGTPSSTRAQSQASAHANPQPSGPQETSSGPYYPPPQAQPHPSISRIATGGFSRPPSYAYPSPQEQQHQSLSRSSPQTYTGPQSSALTSRPSSGRGAGRDGRDRRSEGAYVGALEKYMPSQLAILAQEQDRRLAALEASSLSQHAMISEQKDAQAQMHVRLSDISQSMNSIAAAFTALTTASASSLPPLLNATDPSAPDPRTAHS